MIQRGIYQVCFRGLSLRECWRSGGLLWFPFYLVSKLIAAKGYYIWLPAREALTFCESTNLSQQTMEHLAPLVSGAAKLGYHTGRFIMPTFRLDKYTKNTGGYAALHQDGQREILVTFNVIENSSHQTIGQYTTVSASFLTHDGRSVNVVTDNPLPFMDNPESRCVSLHGAQIEDVARRIELELQNSLAGVRHFSDIESFIQTTHAEDDGMYLRRIERGLYLKVGPDEEARLLSDAKNESPILN